MENLLFLGVPILKHIRVLIMNAVVNLNFFIIILLNPTLPEKHYSIWKIAKLDKGMLVIKQIIAK